MVGGAVGQATGVTLWRSVRATALAPFTVIKARGGSFLPSLDRPR